MFRILICLFILLNINVVFAGAYNNFLHRNSYDTSRNYYNIPISEYDLSALEKYTLNKTFPRQNPIARLERLENLAFGSIQEGDLRSRYKNVERALLSRPNFNNKRTTLGNIVNYFTGQPTGITPPVYSKSNFNNYYPVDNMGLNYQSQNYGTQRFNQYSNGIFGHGYGYMNSALGNGSSINILP